MASRAFSDDSAPGRDLRPVSGLKLDVSIVSFFSDIGRLSGTLSSLADAFRHLQTSLPDTVLAVTIVDNTGDHLKRYSIQLKAVLAHVGVHLEIIYSNANLGYGCANNLALADSTSDYVLVLNPDVLLAEDMLLTAVLYLQEQPDIALLAPDASDPDTGKAQYLHKRYPGALTFASRFLGVRASSRDREYYEMRAERDAGVAYEPLLVSGCCMMLPTPCWKRLGGFSEQFFLYFEDYDLSLRAGNLGRVVALPALRISHYGGGAGRKGLTHIRLFLSSAVKFFNHYGWQLTSSEKPPARL
ncbi:glycosyltransferase [Allohahella marinimesophila]|uniref:Glycosyltransferase family 2 protein n=1 Tax=Allohahella marinimesophila TaxID=1054972 RepID=A0ABP7NVU6_9GAMM